MFEGLSLAKLIGIYAGIFRKYVEDPFSFRKKENLLPGDSICSCDKGAVRSEPGYIRKKPQKSGFDNICLSP